MLCVNYTLMKKENKYHLNEKKYIDTLSNNMLNTYLQLPDSFSDEIALNLKHYVQLLA